MQRCRNHFYRVFKALFRHVFMMCTARHFKAWFKLVQVLGGLHFTFSLCIRHVYHEILLWQLSQVKTGIKKSYITHKIMATNIPSKKQKLSSSSSYIISQPTNKKRIRFVILRMRKNLEVLTLKSGRKSLPLYV